MLIEFAEKSSLHKIAGIQIRQHNILRFVNSSSESKKQGIQRRALLGIHLVMSQQPVKTLQREIAFEQNNFPVVNGNMVKRIMILVGYPQKLCEIPWNLERILGKPLIGHNLVNICRQPQIRKVQLRNIPEIAGKKIPDNGVPGTFPVLVKGPGRFMFFLDLIADSSHRIFQLVFINWLGQVKINSIPDRSLRIRKIRVSAENNKMPGKSPFSGNLHDFNSGQPWHSDIQKNQIRGKLHDFFQSFISVFCLAANGKTKRFPVNNIFQTLQNNCFIICNQNFHSVSSIFTFAIGRRRLTVVPAPGVL